MTPISPRKESTVQPVVNPAIIHDPANPEHRKQLRPPLKHRLKFMDAGDRLALEDFLRTGHLPMLRTLSNLVRGGFLRRTEQGYVARNGVREMVLKG